LETGFLYIDYKKTFDSIQRQILYDILNPEIFQIHY